MTSSGERYYSGESGRTLESQAQRHATRYHSAAAFTPAVSQGGGGGSGASGSEQSVSLAPPAWAVRLFGGPAAAGGSNQSDVKEAKARQCTAEETIESLRESSVIVRPGPLAVEDNTSSMPCMGSPPAANPAQSTWRHGSSASTAAPAASPAVLQPRPPPVAAFEQQAGCHWGPAAAPVGTCGQHAGSHGGPGAAPAAAPPPPPPLPTAAAAAAPAREPPPGRFGWLYQHPATAPSLPSVFDSDSWVSDGLAQAGQGPLPQSQQHEDHNAVQHPPFRPPSAASMARFLSSQQQLLPGEAPQFGSTAGAAAAAAESEKPSPTKSIDASVFHLHVHAGAIAEEAAAAACTGGAVHARQRPSRTAALRQRHLRQLRQQRRDQYGVPVASTARPFSLWASPQRIGEACTGLGVYFASVKQFIVAALLLSLVAIYPLVSNMKSQKWSASYNLVVDEVPLLSCDKGWDTSSWVTGTTAGSRCSSRRYSSSHDCPARCTWTAARLTKGQCEGLPLPKLPRKAAAAASNATCLLHPPCSSGGTSNPAAADGPCYCCELELEPADAGADPASTEAASSARGSKPSSANAVPTAQLWVLFVGQLAFLLWMLALTHAQLGAVHQADARVVSASDYTAIIHGVPRSVDDTQLREWCSHYGSVVAAFNIPDAGDTIRVANRLQELLVSKAESDAWLCSSACGWSAWWFSLFALGGASRLRLQRRLEDAARKLRCYERQDLRPTGMALAVFEYAEHATNCIEDHHRTALRRALDNVMCGATATAPRLGSRRVQVARAPEPSDIIWQHTACTGSAAFTRRLASAVLTLLIMAAGAGVQYGLAVAAEEERKKRLSALYRYGTVVDGTLDFSSWAAFTASALQVTKLNALSMLSGVAVVLVNWLVTVAVRKLAVLERWHTRTASERWALLKLSVAYLTNAFVVPLLAAYFAGSTSSWYSRGGLQESVFFMQVANAILPPLAVLCDLEDWFYYQLVSRSAKTQAMMNRLLQPPPFLLAEQYAAAVTTLGVALLWMPLLPISPFIAAAGLFLGYWVDKYVALRRAADPGNMGGRLVSSAAVIIRLLPLAQLLLMRFLYFLDESGMEAVFWAGLAVWLLFAVAPLSMLLGLVQRRHSTVTGGMSYQETLGSGQRQGLDDHYAAQLPPCCSPTYHHKVAAVFRPLPAPHPATEVLLQGQNAALGGAATHPPFRPDRDAERALARAAASLRARQQVLGSMTSSFGNHQGSSGGGATVGGGIAGTPRRHVGQPQGPAGGSRLVRGLSAVKDSLAQGTSWLRSAPNPDNLFSFDWRQGAGSPRPSAAPQPGSTTGGTAPPLSPQGTGMSPFQPMGRAMASREWSGGASGGTAHVHTT